MMHPGRCVSVEVIISVQYDVRWIKIELICSSHSDTNISGLYRARDDENRSTLIIQKERTGVRHKSMFVFPEFTWISCLTFCHGMQSNNTLGMVCRLRLLHSQGHLSGAPLVPLYCADGEHTQHCGDQARSRDYLNRV